MKTLNLYFLMTAMLLGSAFCNKAFSQDTDNNGVWIEQEQKPEFPGGQEALIRFLSENVKYPAIAKENGIEGRTVCSFIVEKDGSITEVEVVRSAGDPSLDKEAVRVLKCMPKWIPGTQKGKPVRVRYTIPVNFRITNPEAEQS